MKRNNFILLFLLVINSHFVYAQTWSNMGDGLEYSVNSIVYFNGSIYAASDLVYQWTGDKWNTVSYGMNGFSGVTEIDAMTVYNNTLFAGGTFFVLTPDQNWYNYAAKLYNGSWTTCGSGLNNDGWGMDDIPLVMISYGGSLYAGGKFTSAGGDPLNPQITMYIARFDGANWSPVGSGLNEHITDMTIYDNQLIVSGYFTSAGGIDANYIAAWDGGSWHALGTGMSSSNVAKVTALTVYNDELYAGGYFEAAGGNSAANIAKWDGNIWSPVGDGLNGQLYTLASYNGKLYAGGDFGNYIAEWDGVQWSSAGGGTNGSVNFLFVKNNKLYAGGNFTAAGDQSAKNIAVWSDNIALVKNEKTTYPGKFNLYQNYPNPFNPTTKIRFQIPSSESVSLKIYNTLGNEISTLVNEEKPAGNYEIRFDAENLPSGIYFYKIEAGNYSSVKKMILLK